jgi:DNA-directed RNA polymerase subunit F
MKTIEDFVDKLIQDKGFKEEDPDVIAQMKQDLLDRVENRINAMILSNIKPEKIEDFKKILDEGTEEQIQEFVKSDVPDIDEKVATELLTFKNIYLG